MLTICEGLDKCGKSTYIRNHVEAIFDANATFCADITRPAGNGQYAPLSTLDMLYSTTRPLPSTIGLHFGSDDIEPFVSVMKCLNLSHRTHIFLDRSFISELAYGRVYRETSRLSLAEEQTIINELKRTPHEILYFRRKLDTKYFKELSGEDEFERDREKIIKVNDEYNRIMRQYSKAGLNVYEISFNVKRS